MLSRSLRAHETGWGKLWRLAVPVLRELSAVSLDPMERCLILFFTESRSQCPGRPRIVDFLDELCLLMTLDPQTAHGKVCSGNAAVQENLVSPNSFFFRTLTAVMLKIYLISEILRGGIRPRSMLARANGRETLSLLVWTQLRGV